MQVCTASSWQLTILQNLKLYFLFICSAQSAGAVEYTDCILAEG